MTIIINDDHYDISEIKVEQLNIPLALNCNPRPFNTTYLPVASKIAMN